MRDLVPFVKLKKREKHPWRSVTFRKVAGFGLKLTKSNTPAWVFSHFLNCANGTKSRNASQMQMSSKTMLSRRMTRAFECSKTV